MIYLSPEAAADMERVREFLDINNPEAAKRALRTIFAALERVVEFPDLGRRPETPTSARSSFPSARRVTSSATRSCPRAATRWCCACGTGARRGSKRSPDQASEIRGRSLRKSPRIPRSLPSGRASCGPVGSMRTTGSDRHPKTVAEPIRHRLDLLGGRIA